MFLTILSTTTMFLFQVYQDANRIDPNAADQQGVIDVTPLWLKLVFSAVILVFVGFLFKGFLKRRQTKVKGVSQG